MPLLSKPSEKNVNPLTEREKFTCVVVSSSKLIGSEFLVVVITDSASKIIEVESGVVGEGVVFTEVEFLILFQYDSSFMIHCFLRADEIQMIRTFVIFRGILLNKFVISSKSHD